MNRVAGVVSQKLPKELKEKTVKAMLSRHEVAKGSLHSEQSEAGQALIGTVGQEKVSVAMSTRFSVVANGASAVAQERILRGLEQYGLDEFLKRNEFDCSFVAVDKTDGSVALVRDRFGLRPLYYHEDSKSGALWFGSRLRFFFAVQGFDFSVSNQFVGLFTGSHYRTIDNAPEESPFSSVSQVPAASYLRWESGKTRLVKYWQLQESGDETRSEGELAEEYRELLMKAVKTRLDLSSRQAFTLSGGLDSSSVLSCAVDIQGKKQEAFSSVYDDATYDESTEIQSMLGEKVSQWHPILIAKPDLMKQIGAMVRVHDEPVATATWLSHYVLMEKIRDGGFRAIFGGLGGDELNAGEYEYFFFHFADLKKTMQEGRLGKEIEKWAEYHDHPIYRKNAAVAAAGWTRLTDQSRPGVCLSDRGRVERYADTVQKDFFDVRKFVPVMDNIFKSYMKNRTYQDLFRETMPCCVRAEDRHSAHYGVENFLPFLDSRLVEFMFRVPGSLKIRDGVTKILLREAMKGVLPEETRTRIKKMGWNAPAHKWFSEEAYDDMAAVIASKQFRERGIYDAPVIQRLLEEHREIVKSGAAKENHMMFFWQVMNMELWLRWVDEERSRAKSA